MPAGSRYCTNVGLDVSHAAAADLLGCTEATVSWHIHEAKKRLKLIMSAGEV